MNSRPMPAVIEIPSRTTEERDSVRPIDSALCAGLWVLLVFGVLAFGAVEPWSIAVQRGLALFLLLLWVASRLVKGAPPVVLPSCFAPALLFAGLIAVQIFAHTAYQWATLNAAADYVAYGIVLFLTAQIAAQRRLRHQFLVLVIWFGVLLAFFAIVQRFTSDSRIYWYLKPSSERAFPFGPYVNHNHYAGVMEMLAPFALVFSMSRKFRGSVRALIAFSAALMEVSVFLSESRGGMVAITAEILLLGILVFLHGSGLRKLLYMLVVVACVGLMVWLAGNRVADRFATVPYSTRLALARDSWHMAREHPLLGFGLGTFASVYPKYATFPTNLYFDHVHNDYLELLVETGWLGIACMVAFLVMVYRSALRRRRSWTMSEGAAISIAAAIGISGILVHSVSDFNLHIPANAALFFALAGIARSLRSERGAGREERIAAEGNMS